MAGIKDASTPHPALRLPLVGLRILSVLALAALLTLALGSPTSPAGAQSGDLYLTKTVLNVEEGYMEEFGVRPASKPSTQVIVRIEVVEQVNAVFAVYVMDSYGTTLRCGKGSVCNLRFDPVNWNRTKYVGVSALPDDDNENGSGKIKITTVSGDSNFNGIQKIVDTREDDQVGAPVPTVKAVVVSAGSDIYVNEGGSAYYSVSLSQAPSADVTVTLSASGDGSITVSPASLTFTTDNYDTTQSVTLTAAEDDDGLAGTTTIAHAAANGGYNNISKSLTATEVENDEVKFVVSPAPAPLELTEGGTSHSYTVKLASQPTASVAVGITETPDDDGITVSPSSLTFTMSNWNTAQTVTIAAVEDSDYTADTATVSHTTITADTSGYGSLTIGDIVVTAKDNDAAIFIDTDPDTSGNQTALVLEEGRSSATYKVKLSNAPTGNVTVSISETQDPSTGNVKVTSSKSLTFTTSNWDTTKNVTVRAYNDQDAINGTPTINHAASGGGFDNISGTVTVDEIDSQMGINVKKNNSNLTNIDVVEGATATYDVSINAKPATDVTVTIAAATTGNYTDADITVSPATLTFTSQNYSTAQTVTLSAADDIDVADGRRTINHTATYAGKTFTKDITAREDDDDTGGLTFDTNTVSVNENGTGTYRVKLTHKPHGTVNVRVSVGSGDNDISVRDTNDSANGNQTGSIPFTADNYDTYRTVTLAARNDADSDNGSRTINHTANGGGYSNITGSVTATEVDDDHGIFLSPSAVSVPEEGTATYTVKMATAPTASVTVTIAEATTGSYTDSDITVTSPATKTLTFTTQNWNTAQTVTLSAAADNDLADGKRTITHTSASSDSTYNNLTSSLTATEDDNDTGGLAFDKNSVSVNENGTGTYQVKLTHKPNGTVYVQVRAATGGSNDTDITVRDTNDSANGNQTGSIPYTADNWNTYRTVTLAARDDADNAAGSRTIDHTANGGGYSNVTGSVTANEVDDEHGVILSASSLSVTEGSTADYTVKLATPPTANVTVAIAESSTAPDNDTDITVTTPATKSLTFTSVNYGTAQTVTLTAAHDSDRFDGSRTITHTATSSDSSYNNLSVSLTATEDDDDSEGDRDTAKEFSVTEDSNGIWSDGTTMWVSDSRDDKIYAYTLATGAADTSKDITLHTDNGNARGIWSDGTTLWVADRTDRKVYAYTLSSGTRVTAKEFSLYGANRDPYGMWSDGATLWVANAANWGVDRVWAYNLATGALDTSRSFELPSANSGATGIWSDGTTLWVADSGDTKMYAYTLVGGTRDTTKEFDLNSGNSSATGVWSNGTTMWVSDDSGGTLYAYHAPVMTQRLTADDATAYSMRLTIAWHPENWYYKYTSPSGGQCSASAVSTASTRVTGLALNRAYTFAAYSDSSCSTLLATANALETRGSHLALSAFTSTTTPPTTYDVTLTLANWDNAKDGNWSYKTNLSGARGNCVEATANPATVDDFSFSANENHVFSAYRGSTCSGSAIAQAPRFKPSDGIPDLTAGSITLNSAKLTLSNYTGTWWQNSNYGSVGCTRVGSATTTGALTSLARGASHTYHAFSASGCAEAKKIDTVSFTTGVVGGRITDKDFSLDGNVNYNPYQAWSDGTTLWVLDRTTNNLEVYAYTLADGARDTSKEFTLNSANDNAAGIWSDGTTVWVAEDQGGSPAEYKLYAYTLATGARDTSKEFAMNSANDSPTGIWSDGTTIWVGDRADRKLYAYTLATGARDTSKEFALEGISGIPTDLWSDGTTMWAAEYYGGKLQAYNLSTGTRERDKEFDLLPNPSPNVYPAGFWSDGTTMWVVDYNNGKVYAYHMYQPVPDPSPDPSLAAGSVTLTSATLTLSNHTGAWWHNSDYGAAGCTRVSAGTDTSSLKGLTAGTSYIFNAYSASGCADTRKIASVSFTTGAPGGRITDKDVNLDGANASPRGSWSDGTTLWVANNGTSVDKLFAYTLSSGARDSTKDITLNSANAYPSGIWSDGTTMWVADSADTEKVFAYTLATGARDTTREFNLASSSWSQTTNDNANPLGMWSDGTTLWVGDTTDKKLYAYTLAGGARDRHREFALHTANAYPRDYWSDGTTLWVGDVALKDKLFAYTLATGERDMTREFDLETVNSTDGIWSDGATLWAVSYDPVSTNIRAHAFHMYPPTKQLIASGIGKNGATLNITWHDEDWWYKRIAPTGNNSCRKVSAGTDSATLTGLNSGTRYVYNAYDNSGCRAGVIATGKFSTTTLIADDPSATTVGLTLTDHTGDWWYRYTSPSGGKCSEKITEASTRATGLDVGRAYTFAAYSNSACTSLLTRAISVSTLQPTLTAVAGADPGTVTLELRDGWVITEWLSVPPWIVNKDGNWHLKYTTPAGGVCSTPQMAESGTPPVPFATVTNLAVGVAHTFAAYSDSACSKLVATSSPVTPSSSGAGGAGGAGGAFGPRFQIQESQAQQPPPDDPAIVPDAPASVNASRSNGDVAVSWSSADGATGYDVQYSTDDKATWARAATNHAGTTYTLSNADDTKTYVVGVRAVNDAGASGWTDSAQVSPPQPDPPSAVASVSVVHNGGSLSVSWTAADGATGYDVVYSTDDEASWDRATTNHAGTSYTLSNADDTKTYVVGVRAVNSAGESLWTNSAPASRGAPSAVASVSAVHNGDSLSVSWPAAAEATGYDVVYITYDKSTWERAVTNHAGTTYTLSNADSAKTYIFGVRAVNDLGESQWTNSAPASRGAPGAVASVSVVHNGDSLSVSWTAADGATGYDVVYSTDNKASWKRAATKHAGTSYTLSNTDGAKTYVVGVRAVNDAGESGWTDAAPASPPGAGIAVPG